MLWRLVSPDPGGVMTTADLSSIGAAPPALFLVELRAAIGVPTDLDRMQRDLISAMVRLRAGGVELHCAGSLYLPEDARCLSVFRGDRATVALACDAAGLTAAPVYEAYRLPDPATTAQHIASPPQEKD